MPAVRFAGTNKTQEQDSYKVREITTLHSSKQTWQECHECGSSMSNMCICSFEWDLLVVEVLNTQAHLPFAELQAQGNFGWRVKTGKTFGHTTHDQHSAVVVSHHVGRAVIHHADAHERFAPRSGAEVKDPKRARCLLLVAAIHKPLPLM